MIQPFLVLMLCIYLYIYIVVHRKKEENKHIPSYWTAVFLQFDLYHGFSSRLAIGMAQELDVVNHLSSLAPLAGLRFRRFRKVSLVVCLERMAGFSPQAPPTFTNHY